MSLESPTLTVRREKTGITNLETLLPKTAPAQKSADQPAAPAGESVVLDVDEIAVAGATVVFSDLFPRFPFKTTLAPIDIKVTQLSTRPDTKGNYAVTLKTEAKEEIALDGTMSLAPLQVDGKVAIQAVILKKYAPYYSDLVLFDIESGTLNLSSRYQVSPGDKEPAVVASEAAVSVSALRLKRRDESEDFLRVPALSVTDTTIDLTQRQIVVGGVSTQKGFLGAKRLAGGELDLLKLVPPSPAAPGQATTPASAEQKPWVVTLKRLAVDQYTVKVEDRAPVEPITLAVEKIRLNAENLSTAKNSTGKIALSLLLDQTATVKVNTTVGLDPLRADGKVEITGVVLNRYAPYYKNLVAFDVQDGVLDAATGYRASQGKDAFDVKLAGLATSIKSLRLQTRDTKQEFLHIPVLAVKNTAVDLTQQDVSVGEMSTERGNVVVIRTRDGEINLASLLPRATAAAESLADAPGTARPAAGPGAVQPARPWIVKAGAIAVNQYRIHVTDEVPSESVKVVVEDLTVRAERLSTAPNSTPGKASVSLRLDQGTVSTEGTLDIAPVQADLQVVAKDIDLRPFQPYIADRVKIAITDGRVSTAGRLELSTKEPPGLQAKYTGEITLGKFAAVEKSTAEDILKWESLALTELSVGYNPLFVHAKKVALADFFAHLVIQPDGRLNLQEIAATEAASPQPRNPRLPPRRPKRLPRRVFRWTSASRRSPSRPGVSSSRIARSSPAIPPP